MVMRRQGVTVRDVAREAKVSVASVSRALNGLDNVTDETRDRILEAARRLRYVPHNGARFLSTSRTDTIGVVLPDLHGEFFSEVIRGADAAAHVCGRQLLLSSSHEDRDTVASVIRSMRGRVDGLLIMSPHVDARVLSDNLTDDLPVVLLNTQLQAGEHPRFMVDNYAGAFAVVSHLAERAQLIAHITGPKDNYEAEDRRRGWADGAAGRHGPVLPGDFTEQSGFTAGQALARMAPRPDAVFAANDTMAIGCMDALARAGMRVPEDIAVAGFDDIPIARLMRPALTTASTHIADLSRHALERLVRLIDRGDAGDDLLQTIRPELILRESTLGRTTPP